MSDWMLYHVWGIRGYRVTRLEKVDRERVLVNIEATSQVLRCPRCGTADVTRKGSVRRLFHGTPVGSKQMYFEAAIPRVHCDCCGITRQVRIAFAEEKRRHTRQFERYALELAQITTTQQAAQHLEVSWDTVRDIEVRYLGKKYRKPKLKRLRKIAIDEIYLGKSVKFLTVVLDLDSGAIVFVGPGKGAEALDPFWKRLHGSRAHIEAVAADMSPAYALAVHQNLPDAMLVNDRFHVVKLYNEMLTELRRELYREAHTQLERSVLKGTRWLLLKRMDNLDDERDEPARLLRALELNQSLATAYYLKDDLNQFWEQPDKSAAGRFLDGWLRDAEGSGIRLLQKFAKTLASRRRSLLAWYDYPISTGPLEAVNNKIKLLNRQAFGYRDREFFQLKLFALHNARYALLG
jgi:transposase